jgi:ribosomal-protein-alanine N-acetyltransferase
MISPPVIVVRDAGAPDAELMAHLHAACFDPAWSAHDMLAHLRPPLAVAAIATLNDQPTGFLLAREIAGEAEVLSIGVRPAGRRCGVAARLLAHLEQAVADRLGRQIFLDVAADNVAAIAAYHRAGYRETDRRRAYYAAPGNAPAVDAIVMSKRLT